MTPREYQARWDTRRRSATLPETALRVRDLAAGCSLVIAVFTLIPFVLIVIGG